MKLTEKEEKIARLALDKAAADGERAAAATKLIESLHARGVTVEDIQEAEVHTEYVYSDPPPPPRPRRTDAPWDPDPAVRRRNYEAADAAARQWDRQYGYGYPYSAPEPTPEPTPEEEEADRKYRAECEREEREKAEREREAQARERARQAAFDALPGYRKLAISLGFLLGPYAKNGFFYKNRAKTVEEKQFETKVSEIFGHIILVLVELTLVAGIGAMLFH
jgi:hypothetical protein